MSLNIHILITGAAFLFSSWAWAATQGAMGSSGVKPDDRRPAALALIHVEGQLSCNLGVENHGQSCTPEVTDTASGRTYRLEGSDVLRVYFGGARRVSIDGTPNGDSIQVKTIRGI